MAALGDKVIPLPGSAKSKRVLENTGGSEIVLSVEDFEEINQAIAAHDVKGDRYIDLPPEALHLWG